MHYTWNVPTIDSIRYTWKVRTIDSMHYTWKVPTIDSIHYTWKVRTSHSMQLSSLGTNTCLPTYMLQLLYSFASTTRWRRH